MSPAPITSGALTESQLVALRKVCQSWVGTPFHHNQRVKGAGVDCANFLIAVYSELGLIHEFDPGYYPPDWMMHRSRERFEEVLSRYARRVYSPLPGDAGVVKVGRTFSHGFIYMGGAEIVHARINAPVGKGSLYSFDGRDVHFWRIYQ